MQPLCNWALQCKTDFLFDSYTINESKNLHKILKKCKEVKNNKQGMVLSWGVNEEYDSHSEFVDFTCSSLLYCLLHFRFLNKEKALGREKTTCHWIWSTRLTIPLTILVKSPSNGFYVIEAVRESLCRFQFSKRIVQHDTHTSTRHGTYRKGKWGGPTWMMLRYFLSLPLWRFFC